MKKALQSVHQVLVKFCFHDNQTTFLNKAHCAQSQLEIMSAFSSPKKGKGGSITVHNSEMHSELLGGDPEQCEKVVTSQVM